MDGGFERKERGCCNVEPPNNVLDHIQERYRAILKAVYSASIVDVDVGLQFGGPLDGATHYLSNKSCCALHEHGIVWVFVAHPPAKSAST
jgi:hypothetical protein